MFQVQVQGGFKVQVRVLCGLGFRVELRVRVSGQGFREFFFLTLLFHLLSLAQEGQGWLKEGTVAQGGFKVQVRVLPREPNTS